MVFGRALVISSLEISEQVIYWNCSMVAVP